MPACPLNATEMALPPRNRVGESGLASLANLSNALLVAPWRTQVTEKDCAPASWPRLETLDLSGRSSRMPGLRQLTGLTHLRDLNVQGTSVTPAAETLQGDCATS